MRREAHMIESLWIKGEWVDDVIFAILRSEWRGPRPTNKAPTVGQRAIRQAGRSPFSKTEYTPSTLSRSADALLGPPS